MEERRERASERRERVREVKERAEQDRGEEDIDGGSRIEIRLEERAGNKRGEILQKRQTWRNSAETANEEKFCEIGLTWRNSPEPAKNSAEAANNSAEAANKSAEAAKNSAEAASSGVVKTENGVARPHLSEQVVRREGEQRLRVALGVHELVEQKLGTAVLGQAKVRSARRQKLRCERRLDARAMDSIGETRTRTHVGAAA
eukprot:500117-Pleurochrysis_carterae.AAC.1